MGNVGINSVGTESVYQNGQDGRTECLVGVLWEDLTRETQLSASGLTLCIPACVRHMSYFAGC